MRTKLFISILLLLVIWLPCQAQLRTIKGKILFEDGDPTPINLNDLVPRPGLMNSFFRPARCVQLSVEAIAGGTTYLIGRGHTDDQGSFSLTVLPHSVFPNITLIMEINNVAVRVWVDLDADNETLENIIAIPSTQQGDIDLGERRQLTRYSTQYIDETGFGFRSTTVVSFNAAMNINEVILATRGDIISNRDPSEDDVINQVDVEYGDEDGTSYSSNIVITGTLVNNQVPVENDRGLDDGFVDQVIAHEYSHHLQHWIGAWNCCGGEHGPCTLDNEELAWSEGFAEYIGFHMIFKPDGSPRLNMTRIGSTLGFLNLDNMICRSPCTSNDDLCWISQEAHIFGILWDLRDTLGSGDDAWDHVDGTAIGAHNTIIQIFDNELDPWGGDFADAPDLIEFYQAWVGRRGTSDREWGQPVVDPILNRFGIVPGGETNGTLRKMPPVAFVESNPFLPDVKLSVPGGTPIRQYQPPLYDPYSPIHLTIDRRYSYLRNIIPTNVIADVFHIRIGVSNLGAITMKVNDIRGTTAQANGATFNATSTQPWLSVTPASGSFSPQTLIPLEIRFLPQVFDLLLGYHFADVNVQFNIMTNNGVQTQTRTIRVNFYHLDRPDTDIDHDGLTNQYEKERGGICPDPMNSDSDGDRLRDGEEVNMYHTNPCNRDTDGDGFSDWDEIYCYRDRLIQCECFNPLVFDAAASPSSDPDGDGLTNREEGPLGTHPCRQDTDNDGVNDKEDNCPTTPNPIASPGEAQADFDGDGKGDFCDPDADNDGCPNICDPDILNPECVYTPPRPHHSLTDTCCSCEDIDLRTLRGIFILNARAEEVLYLLNGGRRPLPSCDGLRCPPPMVIMMNKKFEVIGEIKADELGFDEKSGFGMASLILPDLDGDSISEIAIGAPYTINSQGHKNAGAVVIISSKTRKKLGYFEGTSPGTTLGMALALRGNKELAIGAPGHKQIPGAVYITSLPDLRVTSILKGSEIGDEFGSAISSLEDFDGDGTTDLLIGAPNANGKLPAVGAVYLTLGRGYLKRIGEGKETGDRFGHTILYTGDTSGDNIPEVLVAAPMAAKLAGEVTLLSLSGHRLWSQPGNSSGERFGTAMAVVATDRVRGYATEFLIGAPGAGFMGKKNAGRGYLLSADGESLDFITGQEEGLELGSIVSEGPTFEEGGNSSLVLISPNFFDGKYIGRSNFYLRKAKVDSQDNR